MEVLVLGFPRTGTQSIAAALAKLGDGHVYHMREVGKNSHQKYWIAALEAKYAGKGAPFGRAEFDQFLGEYDAISDFPASIFASEFMRAYPTAKIILSTREEDAWFHSMMSTLWHAYSNPPPNPTKMRELAVTYNKFVWGDDFPRCGREAYRKYNEDVRKLGKELGREVLEYNVRDGWGPLCGFLGKDVPDESFPRQDDWVEYKKVYGKNIVS